MARTKPNNRQSLAKDTRTESSAAVSLSAFHPDLPLYALASLALSSWHIRLVDPTDQSIRNEYSLDKGQTCKCLVLGSRESVSKAEKTKKKRKVDSGISQALLGVGISDGSVDVYSASDSDPVARLTGAHSGEVLALCFAQSAIWSAGSDGQAIEWDIHTFKRVRTIPTEASSPLRSISITPETLLASSYTISQFSLTDNELQQSYTNHTTPVHSLLIGPDSKFISAAQDDRYMNVFSSERNTQERSLVAEADVRRISYRDNVLCAVTVDGSVELFKDPFANPESSKVKRRKSMILTAASKVTVVRPAGEQVEVVDASLRADGQLLLSWTEGARIVFEAIQITDEQGGIVETTELVRAKKPTLGATNGTTDTKRKIYHDGNAHIGAGGDVADLDMDESHDEGEEVQDSDQSEDAEEPTLAERLHSMDVTSAAPAKTPVSKEVLKMPSAGSLTTVLTQALRSSDTALLESCLHHNDSNVILATVKRLDPTLAVALLEQLAKRLARRPGRSTDLGVWVRWTIVVHGGYLSSLPGLVKTLSSLHNVLSDRAAALPRLLALQGRLDMVQAQIELRRDGRGRQEEIEETGAVDYIEGQSDLSGDEEIGIEDASQLGDLDSSDEDEEEDESEGEDAADFSDDSQAAGEFDELDAQMEMMQSEDDEEDIEEIEGASDDDA